MYNKVFLIGRLVRDPDVRVSVSGIPISRFTIAVTRVRKRDNQEEITDFLKVTTFRRLAEICGQYLKKGKLVAVEGRLQFSPYEKEGKSLVFTEIVADNFQMLDRASQGSESSVTVDAQPVGQ